MGQPIKLTQKKKKKKKKNSANTNGSGQSATEFNICAADPVIVPGYK